MKLTQQTLREILHYDPETGIFTYKQDRGKRKKKKGDLAGWRANTGYWMLSLNYTTYLAHRVAWLYMTGNWPNHTIDHIDLDRGNNKWNNLRDVPHAQNCSNSPAKKNKNYGLYWDKQRGLWKVQFWENGKATHYGRFPTIELATAKIRQIRQEKEI